MSIAVSNTSPLLAFSAIGRLDLLRNAFDEILVPAAVRDELSPPGTIWNNSQAALQAITHGTWLKVAPVPQPQIPSKLRRRLGAGEAAAIALAIQRGLPLLIDDLEGREAGRTLGLEVVGTLGVVARNKVMGAITEAKPIVQAMHQVGIYYSQSLIHDFLVELGETT